jgi:hypothetical protein
MIDNRSWGPEGDKAGWVSRGELIYRVECMANFGVCITKLGPFAVHSAFVCTSRVKLCNRHLVTALVAYKDVGRIIRTIAAIAAKRFLGSAYPLHYPVRVFQLHPRSAES